MRGLVMLCFAMLAAVDAFAQTDRTATLLITVVDETRAVLPGATVTVAGVEAATKAATVAPGSTSQQGQARFESLTPGRYSISAEFPGFQSRTLADVRLRPGENRHALTLPI